MPEISIGNGLVPPNYGWIMVVSIIWPGEVEDPLHNQVSYHARRTQNVRLTMESVTNKAVSANATIPSVAS